MLSQVAPSALVFAGLLMYPGGNKGLPLKIGLKYHVLFFFKPKPSKKIRCKGNYINSGRSFIFSLSQIWAVATLNVISVKKIVPVPFIFIKGGQRLFLAYHRCGP